MNMTPVAIVGSKDPDILKDIQKFSEKWEKRTKALEYAWPKGSTFDAVVCESMETCIKDYKPKDKLTKREGKRELELKILKQFKTEGQNYRTHLRHGLLKLKIHRT